MMTSGVSVTRTALWWALVTVTAVSTAYIGKQEKDVREYCEWESFNATCGPDEVIMIHSARYGRMNLGRCVTQNYGNIGCGSDVTAEFDAQCSGRHQCLITVISLHNKRSCPKDFKSYVEAGYHCQKVATPDNSTCPQSGVLAVTTSDHMASAISQDTGLGGSDCPWQIAVQPYQRINLTIVDFSVPASEGRLWGRHYGNNGIYPGQSLTQKCEVEKSYVTVQESVTNGTRNVTVCPGKSRDSVVYVSEGNSVIITVNLNNKANFMINYQAFGCPPLDPPEKAHLETNGQHAVIRCNETQEAWYLTCRGTEWVGRMDNCSLPTPPKPLEGRKKTDVFGTVTDFPFGILIVVALGVAIGVAIGVMMLVIVLAYMKRRRMRKVRSRSNYILKQVGSEDTLSKPNHDCHPGDRQPMLIKRECVSHNGTLVRVDRDNTWTRTRPLPRPILTHQHLRDEALACHERLVLTPDTLPSPESLPMGDLPPPPSPLLLEDLSPSRFSTFRPSDRLEMDSQQAQRNAYVVGEGHSHSDAPYYFKLDPRMSPSGSGHVCKPDVLQGCAICNPVPVYEMRAAQT